MVTYERVYLKPRTMELVKELRARYIAKHPELQHLHVSNDHIIRVLCEELL